ncbi:MAG TPA: CinA family protein [Micropepsaceae bacterium]|nr:CinA family protein [Micropepsaceae bacterium]
MFPNSVLRLAKALLAQAIEAKLSIAFAESCTGGLIAGAMTELDGASAVVDRGFVVYTNRAKIEMLGVPPELIAQYGAVSEEVARAMSEGALKNSGAQLAVSSTGIAGPTGGTPTKPIGLVHFAAAREGQTTLHLECRFGDIGRSEVRMRSVEAALKLLLQII